jgi:hypothetical protein
MNYPAPNPKYAGPPKFHGAANNDPITRVVIHGTVSRCVPGGAIAVARYFRDLVIRPSSAHYVCDPLFTRQVTWDSVVAYHAPPNQHSIGIELCDIQGGSPRRWRGPNHRLMLNRGALVTAKLCAAYGIPPIRLTVTELKEGKHGICGHVDVSNAFHQTDHTDPGPDFPWGYFMDLVNKHYRRITRKGK